MHEQPVGQAGGGWGACLVEMRPEHVKRIDPSRESGQAGIGRPGRRKNFKFRVVDVHLLQAHGISFLVNCLECGKIFG